MYAIYVIYLQESEKGKFFLSSRAFDDTPAGKKDAEAFCKGLRDTGGFGENAYITRAVWCSPYRSK